MNKKNISDIINKEKPLKNLSKASASSRLFSFFDSKKEFKKESDKKSARIKKDKKTDHQKKPWLFFLRFSVKEQMHFIKRLAFLVYSNVPILDSLHILKKQNRSKLKNQVFNHLIMDVSNGQLLSTALARFGRVFSRFTVSVIKVGELSGNLSKNLTYLAEELGKKQALRRKIIGALVYPAFITVASVSLVTLLVVYIFPKIMPIFFSLNAKLPFTTKALLTISNFLQTWGLVIILTGIILVIIFYLFYRYLPAVRLVIALALLKMPIIGRLTQNYNMVDFCRTFSLLLRSGFTVVQSAEILAEVTGNTVYQREYRQLGKHIINGNRIASYLEKKPKLFPDMIAHMVMIGETAGDLSGTMLYLSEYYEAEVDDQIKNLSSSIEPVLMIFMGVIVGLIAVSVITPIYQITQSLSR